VILATWLRSGECQPSPTWTKSKTLSSREKKTGGVAQAVETQKALSLNSSIAKKKIFFSHFSNFLQHGYNGSVKNVV
jgi:hypothetical protein